MKIAITDANIFIDLIHIDFHEHLFDLDFEIHTSAEIFDELSELQQKSLQPFIQKEVLTLHNCQEVNPIESVKLIRGLSESDKTVLYLAAHLEAFVLSGDGLVRKIAGIQMIEVHGILWLLDLFLDKNLISKKIASKQLKKLMAYNRRLPIIECEQRLADWK